MADELVTLWRYRDLPEALIAQGKLEAEGLTCFLADDNMIRMDWFLSNLIGGVRLQVPREDAEAALEILGEEIPTSFSAEDVGEEFLQPECPECSSRDVTFGARDKKLALLGLGVLRVPVLLPFFLAYVQKTRKSWYCESCGHGWDAQDL